MHKMARRWIAGISVAALFVSAVGTDVFTNVFMRTVPVDAASSNRRGKSTGFSDLEQDTDKDGNYNTGYGLHTNKTASVAQGSTDGRTFDVDLESWYVGENPVDVATILDASGSMAWTVDTLEPLEIDYKALGDFGIKNKDDLIALQNESDNEGYLPQEVVDKILKLEYTDNSKLSYANYKYYVYEDRSTVSEFVPLGYWDGGEIESVKPIGYYPFDGSLKNEAPNGTEGKLIKRVNSGGTFTDDEVAAEPVKVKFNKDSLDLSETDKIGNVIIDLSDKLDTTNEIKIDFELYFESVAKGNNPQSPIIYLGDGSTENQYFFVNRGGSDSSGTSSSKNIRISGKEPGNSGNIDINSLYGKWIDFSLLIDANTNTITLNANENSVNKSFTTSLKSEQLYLILGGNELLINDSGKDPQNLKGNYIKNLKITNGSYSAKFPLTNEAGLTCTDSNGTEITANYYQQSTGTAFDMANPPVVLPVVYTDNALNLTKTANNGAVKLDAKPTDNTYTILFKVKSSRKLENDVNKDKNKKSAANLFYIGSNNTSNHYYHIGIPSDSDPRHLQFYEHIVTTGEDKKYTDLANTNNVFNDTNYKYVAYAINGTKINSYFNITKEKIGKKGSGTLENELDAKDINIILAGLVDTYANDFEIFIDDLYIFDEALNDDQLKTTVKNISSGGNIELTDSCGAYHAKNATEDLAQIKDSLAQNPDPDERRGWYYVNSHSNWADIEGCLTSGKQYVGIYDTGLKDLPDLGKDIATKPSGADENLKNSIEAGDTNTKEGTARKLSEAPEHERSIRFYVDTQGHLRCFAWSGSNSKKGDERTFCSLVYEKKDEQITKYEALNNALNDFYKDLAKDSDLSNSAVVRFSTNNAADDLNMLIMKDWTNWSDHYQGLTADEKESKTDEELKSDYMKNLLIPEEGETSIKTTTSTAQKIEEYPYVMTGGTYTWTGLKAFYENMINKTSGRAYDIANDARDKYLIIFTDGRDNAIEETGEDDNDNVNQAPEEKTATTNSQLAGLWADKLKDEGYTIYCVMMATGSISETANQEEYGKAYKFMKTLVGANEGEERDLTDETDEGTLKKYIHVVKSNSSELNDAFAKIRNEIQQPRHDYNVQDYIDPRFDLVDGNGNLLKLGANGVITNSAGETLATVENFLEKQDAAISYTYTPIASNKVDGECHIYYDDAKDMYYLRWEDQTIPMENKSFNTEDEGGKTLDVWSATIRLKAKADFIGGNNILTNGNEAGENLVYSDATIENMDKDDNYKLYGLKKPADGSKIPLREKLQVLSGTDRKINAVDAGGVSQAVYGDGIDIPSSGFPRVVVDVRLQKLNASDLNDVIYMGEVVSPTMMLADLENGYMTGSYYLEYLERYAYRVYGKGADDMPLIELLNKWLKINDKEEASKTFTIPYIYLPDPEYIDGKLNTKDKKVVIQNSTGASWSEDDVNFADLNLRDVTGFITYTWKRDDDSQEPQQLMPDGTHYDITKEYVVKNTNQIKYNLQLKFTPLQEDDLPADFKLDENFIKAEGGEAGDKFFQIVSGEFDDTGDKKWTIEAENSNRTHYLRAMVKEEKTYTPHIKYDESQQKWQLGNEAETSDKGIYDWDSDYKKAAGNEQIESGKLDTYYTNTPKNVRLVDATGAAAPCSLVANTTYIKDVVNGALALELVVDGKYLGKSNPEIKADKSYTFTATRYYDDPYDPLPYDKTSGKMNADTGEKSATGVKGKKYQLTFKMDAETLPKDPQENQLYTVWATLTQVEVENGSSITEDGYTDVDALPIGTYVIDTTDNELPTNGQFKIGEDEHGGAVNFQYLKTDTAPASYTYDKFPKKVYEVSKTAPDSTGDGEYLIKNGRTDNSPKNIAESNRTKETATQKLTFNFGTVDKNKEGASTIGAKGIGVKDYLKENPDDPKLEKFDNDYAKDRLGIILLSVDPNSLAISKKVTNTNDKDILGRDWTFTITFKPEDTDLDAFKTANDADGFNLTWYKFDNDDGNWQLDDSSSLDHVKTIHFEEKGSTYTVVLKLKHDEKVVIKNLPEGTWQVTETDETGTIFYSAHNNMDEFDDYVPSNKTNEDIALNPNSHVDFVNEFPHELPSAGGIGIDRYIFFGTMFTVASVLFLAMQWVNRKKRRAMQE